MDPIQPQNQQSMPARKTSAWPLIIVVIILLGVLAFVFLRKTDKPTPEQAPITKKQEQDVLKQLNDSKPKISDSERASLSTQTGSQTTQNSAQLEAEKQRLLQQINQGNQ